MVRRTTTSKDTTKESRKSSKQPANKAAAKRVVGSSDLGTEQEGAAKAISQEQPLTCKVLSLNGKAIGELALKPEVFGIRGGEVLVHDTVTWQLSKRRAGTQSTLTRADMKGGGKKPWDQKGTGRARAGSNTSPLWRGGGVIHAPKPRSYESRVPKRTRLQALKAVLSDKFRKEGLVVLDQFNIESGKTKAFVALLETLGLTNSSVLILLPSDNNSENATQIVRASKNLPNVLTLPVEGVNAYDLLKYRYLLGARESILKLEERIHG